MIVPAGPVNAASATICVGVEVIMREFIRLPIRVLTLSAMALSFHAGLSFVGKGALAADGIGSALVIQNKVTGSRSGRSRHLRSGDRIYFKERLKAGRSSSGQFVLKR